MLHAAYHLVLDEQETERDQTESSQDHRCVIQRVQEEVFPKTFCVR